MTTDMKNRFLSILLILAMLMPSAVLADAIGDEWELSASWDFAENENNGFSVNKAITTQNGEGELHWDHNIYTIKKYKKAKLEFDFRIEPFKNSERRLMVDFGAESAVGGSNFSYTDFTQSGSEAHFVGQDSGDGLFTGGTSFNFAENTDYSIRYIVSENAVRLYAKTAGAQEYTYVGERTGLNIGEGKIKIHSHDFGYIKNLKVYAVPELSVQPICGNGGCINAEDSIDLKFSHPVSASDAEEKTELTHDGVKIPFSVISEENVCKIVPDGGILPQRRYNITVKSGLSSGNIVLPGDVNFTVNTKPPVTIAEEFDDNVMENFTKSYASAEEGKLKLDNWGNIATAAELSEYVAEFDYIQENTDGSGRIMIYPRVGVNNFSYIDINDTAMVHIVDDNGDGASDSGMLFSGGIRYSFRLTVTKTGYSLYVSKDSGEYIMLAENEISGTSGAMQITSGGSAYLDNLKIYEYDDSARTEPKEILARSGSSFELRFAADMDSQTISTDNIKLSDDAKEYSIGIVKKSADVFAVTLNEWLAYGAEYKLTFSENVKSIFGSSPDADYAITVKTIAAPDAVSLENIKFNGREFPDNLPAGTYRVTAEAAYNLTEGNINAVCACVVYDENENKSVKTVSAWQPVNLSAEAPLESITFDLTVPAVSSPKMKIFIWDNILSAGFLAKPAVMGE